MSESIVDDALALEKADEIGDNNYYSLFRNKDVETNRWWSRDPEEINFPGQSPYIMMDANPISFTDPLEDCPDCVDGKYTVKEGDTFYDLEKEWKMDIGTLSKLNKGLDPKKLQVDQEIKVTYSVNDIPKDITINSEKSLEGMDGFFFDGQEGVNKIREVTEQELENVVADATENYNETINQPRNNLPLFQSVNDQIDENSHGGIFDFKKYQLNDNYSYSYDFRNWIRNNNSITEPNTRTLYIYKGIGYNLNEFGNLMFGYAHSTMGTDLNLLLFGGHIYSIFNNGALDEENEVRAIKRGYKDAKNK